MLCPNSGNSKYFKKTNKRICKGSCHDALQRRKTINAQHLLPAACQDPRAGVQGPPRACVPGMPKQPHSWGLSAPMTTSVLHRETAHHSPSSATLSLSMCMPWTWGHRFVAELKHQANTLGQIWVFPPLRCIFSSSHLQTRCCYSNHRCSKAHRSCSLWLEGTT